MDVNHIIAFIAGAIVMWIFDWFFYGRDSSQEELEHVRHQLAQAQEAQAAAEANLATAEGKLEATSNDLVQARADCKECDAGLEAARARIAELEAVPAAESKPAPATAAKDNLKQVNGIGPVYEKKLNAAGIMTFAQLAAAEVQAIHDIIAPKEWQALEIDDWIAEAKEFASA